MFAIFDERSLIDGTLLLVDPPEEEDIPFSCAVRIFPQLMEMRLFLRAVGSRCIWRDRERARITSGVFTVALCQLLKLGDSSVARALDWSWIR